MWYDLKTYFVYTRAHTQTNSCFDKKKTVIGFVLDYDGSDELEGLSVNNEKYYFS